MQGSPDPLNLCDERIEISRSGRDCILYAPSVHSGGGFVLLKALLAEWPLGRELTTFLDARVKDKIVIPPLAKVFWVKANLKSRLKAEISLRTFGRSENSIVCFHGLPPIFAAQAEVVTFVQNRLHIDRGNLRSFPLKTRARIFLERAIARAFRRRVHRYIVQTPTMRRLLMNWYGEGSAPVSVLPFAERSREAASTEKAPVAWDFVYVADGQPHKNHVRLVAAWRILAQAGLRPSLALTLGPRDGQLAADVAAIAGNEQLRIENLGELSSEQVDDLYKHAGALIFPSETESFGLPLIEATRAGLPILAAERDYVRDVCVPVGTFDPMSPLSIARAVRRFVGAPDLPIEICSPGQFWNVALDGPAA